MALAGPIRPAHVTAAGESVDGVTREGRRELIPRSLRPRSTRAESNNV